MGHLLLTGSSGVGKSLLAEALAGESRTRLVRVMGYAPRKVLIKKLMSLKHGDILFIDEAHTIKQPEQELCYVAIDRLRVPRLAVKNVKKTGKATGKKTGMTRRIKPFTLIAATDQPGVLLNAFKKRFASTLHLTPYPLAEMREIVATIASELGVLLSPQATGRLARVCHGMPRTAKHYLAKLRHFFPPDTRQLSIGDVEEFLRANNIDKYGFGPQQRKYLRFLKKNDKASLETLAQILGSDKDEVLRHIEPILVRKGLVDIAPGGRRLTAKGRAWNGSKTNKAKKANQSS